MNQFSPDPDGPWSRLNWYIAANYCNWLSEQEGLPKDQCCYLPNDAGAYAEGMTIPADVLERTGIACPPRRNGNTPAARARSPADTYGVSIELLGKYAWFQTNSQDHDWSCGSLLPNDLGLFDMLGNEFEWVQDGVRQPEAGTETTVR